MNDGPSTKNRNDLPPPYTNQPSRSENVPPGVRNGNSGHHMSRSQEERRRMIRHGGRPHGPPDGLNIFADPTEQARQRPRMRRNSDSSIASRLVSPEEEVRRRQRKEIEARHKDNKGRPPGSRPKKPGQRLDIIDSLDVTSIYGTGRKCLQQFGRIRKMC